MMTMVMATIMITRMAIMMIMMIMTIIVIPLMTINESNNMITDGGCYNDHSDDY